MNSKSWYGLCKSPDEMEFNQQSLLVRETSLVKTLDKKESY